MRKKQTLLKLSKLIIPLLVVVFILINVIFVNRFKHNEIENYKATMVESSKHNKHVLSEVMADYIDKLNIIAFSLENHYLFSEGCEFSMLVDDLSNQSIIPLLNDLTVRSGLYKSSIYTTDLLYTSFGEIYDISAFEPSLQELYGIDYYVSDLEHSYAENKTIFTIIMPLECDGVIFSALRLPIFIDDFTDKLSKMLFTSSGYYRIVDGNGEDMDLTYLENTSIEKENLFYQLEGANYNIGYSYEAVLDDVANNRSGFTECHYNNELMYICYEYTGFGDWYLFTTIPKTVINETINHNLQEIYSVIFQISVVMLLILLYMQLMQKKSNENLRIKDCAIDALASTTNKIIVQWNPSNGKLLNNCVLFENFVLEKFSADVFVANNLVYPDDIEIFVETFANLKKNGKVNDARFRFKSNNSFEWYSFSAIILKKENETKANGIAWFENINTQIEKEKHLHLKLSRDTLTNLLNRSIYESRISKHLINAKHDQETALMLIDVDNFKEINDTYGHPVGDLVLKKIAGVLTEVFRKSDIVGRLGGDEFVAFIADDADSELMTKKAMEINEKVASMEIDVPVTVSIGIAHAKGETTFDHLYEIADSAMYESKNNGRNRFTTFNL